MLLNCDAGEDSWESPGQQGDQTSQSWRKSTLNIHWKDWCWSSNTLATWFEELTHWKRPWCWERLKRQEEKGKTEDEMVGQNHWLNGCEFEQVVMDREAWCAVVHGVIKSWDTTELNNMVTRIVTPTGHPSSGFSAYSYWKGNSFSWFTRLHMTKTLTVSSSASLSTLHMCTPL